MRAFRGAAVVFFLLSLCAWAQASQEQDTRSTDRSAQQGRPQPGAAREMASGAGNIGVGAAKGAGHLALGTARGVGSLATLHPVDAAAEVGKGAGSAGKDVAVGTVKGTAKIGRGLGRVIRKIF